MKFFFLVKLTVLAAVILVYTCASLPSLVLAAAGSPDLELNKTVQIIYPEQPAPNQAPVGALEQVNTSGQAVGWAADPDTATSTVTIELYLDGPINQGTLIATVLANLPRPDVTANAHYPGSHGFAASLPDSLRDGQSYTLYAYGLDTTTGAPALLPGFGQSFTVSKAGPKTTQLEQQTGSVSEIPALETVVTVSTKIFPTPLVSSVTNAVSTLVVMPLTVVIPNPFEFFNGMAGVNSWYDVWLVLQRLFYSLLTLIGLRKKRRPWGTVYDSKSKQPLDPAIVTMHDAVSGRQVEQSITDLAGRFGFLTKPGTFFLRAQKTHYKFPSAVITGSADGIFENVYHGEVITIPREVDVVSPNIPMDSEGFDWNQEAKQKIIKIHPRLERFVSLVVSVIFWLAVIFTVLAFIAHPNWLTGVFLGLSFLLILHRVTDRRVRLWGRLYDGQSFFPLPGYQLHLSLPGMPNAVLGKAVTTGNGKFFLKANPGTYILTVQDSSGNLAANYNVTIGSNGLLNSDFVL